MDLVSNVYTYIILILILIVFLSDDEHVPYCYGIFAFITLFGIVFIYFCVPDTNNQALDEIQATEEENE